MFVESRAQDGLFLLSAGFTDIAGGSTHLEKDGMEIGEVARVRDALNQVLEGQNSKAGLERVVSYWSS